MPAARGNDPAGEAIVISGEFTFDGKEELINALSKKYQISVNEPNLALRVPVMRHRLSFVRGPHLLHDHPSQCLKNRLAIARRGFCPEVPQRNALSYGRGVESPF